MHWSKKKKEIKKIPQKIVKRKLGIDPILIVNAIIEELGDVRNLEERWKHEIEGRKNWVISNFDENWERFGEKKWVLTFVKEFKYRVCHSSERRPLG